MPEALVATAATATSAPATSRSQDGDSRRSATAVSAADRAFATAFEEGTLPEFHHVDHVRLAWIYLHRHPVLEALERFVTGLRRYAESKGAFDLYHETITWAYVLLIHERIERLGRQATWQEFADAHPDLMVWQGGLLDRWYRPETLASGLAKRVFVWPDGVEAGSP